MEEHFFEHIIGNLEKLARDTKMTVYHFKAGSSEVIELRKETDKNYHCIGCYISTEDKDNIGIYERVGTKSYISDHLFRVHGPTHPYGRESDPYLQAQKGYSKNRGQQASYFLDLKSIKKDREILLKELGMVIKEKLLPSPKGKSRKATAINITEVV